MRRLSEIAAPRERQPFLPGEVICQGDQRTMNKHIKTAIILCVAICAAGAQVACVAQSVGSSSGKKEVSQSAAVAPSDPPSGVDFAALEAQGTDLGTVAKEV